jgi:TrmH family RNA methyltransferase
LLKVFRRALAEGETREGWLAVEGPHLVEEALKADAATVHSVLVSASGRARFDALLARLPREAEVSQVADAVFRKVAQTENPQGIAALVELAHYDLTPLLARWDALVLVACGIQDPGNLGAIVRSAQAFGATALLTIKETVSPFNPKAVRSSAGAIFHLPVFREAKATDVVSRLRTANVRIIAADRHSPASLAEADLRGAVAFLVGREATGLPPEIAREAALLLSIPIRAETDSLNAATAAGIFLYEAARQRRFRY